MCGGRTNNKSYRVVVGTLRNTNNGAKITTTNAQIKIFVHWWLKKTLEVI
jgi:hypothetical protein